MKTPREILLQRHHAAEPKLDAIRREIVGELNNKETEQPSLIASFVSSFLGCSKTVWRDLTWPNRRTWAGFAAAWVVILSLNFYAADHAPKMARKEAPPSPELIIALREQRLELARLIEPSVAPAADRPKSFRPSPRSERRDEMLAA